MPWHYFVNYGIFLKNIYYLFFHSFKCCLFQNHFLLGLAFQFTATLAIAPLLVTLEESAASIVNFLGILFFFICKSN